MQVLFFLFNRLCTCASSGFFVYLCQTLLQHKNHPPLMQKDDDMLDKLSYTSLQQRPSPQPSAAKLKTSTNYML